MIQWAMIILMSRRLARHQLASQVEVTPMGSVDCNWTAPPSEGHWVVETTANAWTPLGTGWNFVPPFGDPPFVATDSPALRRYRTYCARVRARSNRDVRSEEVYGDYTYLSNGVGATTPATSFKWMGYPNGGECLPGCTPGYLGSGNYAVPQSGTVSVRTPYFTWRPLARRRIVLTNTGGTPALTLYQQSSAVASVEVREHGTDPTKDELVVSGTFNFVPRTEVFVFPDTDLVQLVSQVNGLSPYLGSLLVSAGTSASGPQTEKRLGW